MDFEKQIYYELIRTYLLSNLSKSNKPDTGLYKNSTTGIFASYFVWSLGTGAQSLARPLFAFLVSGQIFFAPLLASTNALARTIAGPITGFLTDRIGRTPMVIVGTVLRAGSSLIEGGLKLATHYTT